MSRFRTMLLVMIGVAIVTLYVGVFATERQGTAAQAAGDPEPATDERQAFGFAEVVRRAEELARQPYERDRPELPEAFRGLQYDQYRDIRFRERQTIWRNDPRSFQMQLFSRGFLYEDRVTINIVDDTGARPLAFSRDLFDYGKNSVPAELPEDMGFAGFRLLYPLNRDDHWDEVAVFLGASYFRAIGEQQNYGVSARGLAIDTGLDKPEEFPVFREFWIVEPARGDTAITVFALLDSERVTGAYRFLIQPGQETVVDVRSRILLREKVAKLGVAPLTSMFYHGEVTDRFMDDFRPEVHDSDGLLIESGGGERIWRPVVNPLRLQITPFRVSSPRGFGLLQRDRDFKAYQDTEAIYHTRPSVWVETVGDWGEGAVELVEIPSQSERNDNLVAFWTPGGALEAGSTADFEYRLHFALDPEAELKGGRATATRIGAGGTDVPDHSRRKFVIDFAGPALRRLGPEADDVEPVCEASAGEITHAVAHHNAFLDGWRLFFELVPENDTVTDLRCFLRRDRDILTETWVFRWAPN